MSDQQAADAANAVNTWVPVVRWLEDVERTVGSAPTIGGVDSDQVEEAEEAVRAARLAIAALVGSYATEAATAGQNQVQQSGPSPQNQTPEQMWSQRQPVSAPRPGDQLRQQPGYPQQQAQPEHYVGWNQ